jgi:hypothetical protein
VLEDPHSEFLVSRIERAAAGTTADSVALVFARSEAPVPSFLRAVQSEIIACGLSLHVMARSSNKYLACCDETPPTGASEELTPLSVVYTASDVQRVRALRHSQLSSQQSRLSSLIQAHSEQLARESEAERVTRVTRRTEARARWAEQDHAFEKDRVSRAAQAREAQQKYAAELRAQTEAAKVRKAEAAKAEAERERQDKERAKALEEEVVARHKKEMLERFEAETAALEWRAQRMRWVQRRNRLRAVRTALLATDEHRMNEEHESWMKAQFEAQRRQSAAPSDGSVARAPLYTAWGVASDDDSALATATAPAAAADSAPSSASSSSTTFYSYPSAPASNATSASSSVSSSSSASSSSTTFFSYPSSSSASTSASASASNSSSSSSFYSYPSSSSSSSSSAPSSASASASASGSASAASASSSTPAAAPSVASSASTSSATPQASVPPASVPAATRAVAPAPASSNSLPAAAAPSPRASQSLSDSKQLTAVAPSSSQTIAPRGVKPPHPQRVHSALVNSQRRRTSTTPTAPVVASYQTASNVKNRTGLLFASDSEDEVEPSTVQTQTKAETRLSSASKSDSASVALIPVVNAAQNQGVAVDEKGEPLPSTELVPYRAPTKTTEPLPPAAASQPTAHSQGAEAV